MTDRNIPADTRRRFPLITPAGYAQLNRIRQHANAPRWNWVVGDRVTAEDLAAVDTYRQALFARRHPAGLGDGRPRVHGLLDSQAARDAAYRSAGGRAA